MSKRKLLVTQIAKGVRVQNQDLRFDFMLNSSAEKELKSLEKMISPELYGIISKLLLGFHGHMQYEMAVDLVIFAHERIAHMTSCLGADYVLDICYAWIASELGFLKRSFITSIYYNN